MEPSAAPVRVDKWLWAARFFKNRTLAAEAVKGGKVEVNGARVKASKDIKPGDELDEKPIAPGKETRVFPPAEQPPAVA